MEVVFAVVAVYAYGSLFGLAMTGSSLRRVLLLVIASLGLVTPFVKHDAPFAARVLLAGGFAISFLRLVDLSREKAALPAWRRVLHATALIEMRRTKRVPPRLHVGGLAHMLAFGVLTAISIAALIHVPPSSRVLSGLAAIAFAYTSFDAITGFVMVFWAALGFDLPLLHNHPIKSRTVAEFWSERWNRTVGAWLRVHCFMPLARRRHPRLGIAAAFAASTALHVYLAWAVFDARGALMWALFFGVQIPIVLAERALRVASWPTPAARLWTVSVMCAASPLFVEPVIRSFDALR